LRVALIEERAEWHRRVMLDAFASLGVEAVPVPLGGIRFTTADPYGLDVPGFPDALPDGVFVRSMPAGTFESTTRRLAVLHAFSDLGVPVWNPAPAIERSVDKSATSFRLHLSGVPTPPSFAVETREEAASLLAACGPLVLKPLFGAQGRGLRLVEREADLPGAEEVAGVYYLQRFVPAGGHDYRDYRVLVVAGRALAAATRSSDTWITNVHQGGRPERAALDEALARPAIAAAAAVGATHAGVDLIREPAGRFLVLEVNSMPAWSGLQSVTDLDIALALGRAFVEAVAGRAAPRHAFG